MFKKLVLILLILSTFIACKKDKKVDDGSITLRVMDWSDSTKTVRDDFHKKFMKENPGVNIEYTLLTSGQFNNTVMTAIRAGDAPDLFPVSSSVNLSIAVNEGWFVPLEEILSKEFLSTLNEGAFVEGYTTLNKDLYVLPENFPLGSSFVYYNKDLFRKAGLDPNTPPATYSEFLDANRKLTKAGKGKFYGMIEGGNQLGRLETIARGWSSVGGSKAGFTSSVTLTDGKTPFISKGMFGVFDLFNTIAKEGNFHPNTISISAPEARAMFAEGEAGFLVQGPWCIGVWRNSHPDFDFGVMKVPTPDSGAKGFVPRENPAPWMGISASSKHKEIAAKYLEGLYSEFYQGAAVKQGGFSSIIKGINEKYMNDPAMLEFYNASSEQTLPIPDPMVVDPKVSNFYSEVRDVQPGLSSIFQGMLAGAFSDYESMLQELNDKSIKEWTRASEKADLNISVFQFDNWDSKKPFTATNY